MRRRAGISAGHSDLSWAARKLSTKQDLAAIKVEPAPEWKPPQRVSHPVIPRGSDRHYRVIRVYRERDHGICIEDIGSCPNLTEALQLSASEIGRARVLAPFIGGNGKQVSDNAQPIESRA